MLALAQVADHRWHTSIFPAILVCHVRQQRHRCLHIWHVHRHWRRLRVQVSCSESGHSTTKAEAVAPLHNTRQAARTRCLSLSTYKSREADWVALSCFVPQQRRRPCASVYLVAGAWACLSAWACVRARVCQGHSAPLHQAASPPLPVEVAVLVEVHHPWGVAVNVRWLGRSAAPCAQPNKEPMHLQHVASLCRFTGQQPWVGRGPPCLPATLASEDATASGSSSAAQAARSTP